MDRYITATFSLLQRRSQARSRQWACIQALSPLSLTHPFSLTFSHTLSLSLFLLISHPPSLSLSLTLSHPYLHEQNVDFEIIRENIPRAISTGRTWCVRVRVRVLGCEVVGERVSGSGRDFAKKREDKDNDSEIVAEAAWSR